ncbi:ABC transporter substrate-binding protein [Roseospira marina]|uniref:ABC transporter substrate-binding protein n=1 Tax=Roseospira marina TaxID=140057 RepID=A0A5M6IEL4_9PROT|nr:TRAP transporter substrate-binding protein DctP [Roseospira marina]KAA5605988.1 ABC transporter substrate-binding protein [Roseospira marina]MBB4313160.1 TRAP-type mannitol/chloroaromatic compound transport system substrate-binding protein [Roseospira marina]MBB5086099.1 TRAP-type mannitol/chloroaromatic compound transport system substrate-binding protein [Roseospira marina]
MSGDTRKTTASPPTDDRVASRRRFLSSAAVGGAAVAATGLSMPSLATAAGQTRNIRIQTSWQPGTTGYKIFETWCASVKEVTGGELAFQPFPAGSVSGDFQLFDAVRNGVLDAMNLFTTYWVSRMPAAVFLTGFPMGPPHPHHWDMLFYSFGVADIARELYRQQGLEWVGLVHHDMNVIHSKKPISSLKDFEGLKIRMPGGIIAECFAAIGARTTLLPGSEVYPALEKGTIDAADYVGPAVDYDLGFQQVAKYIVMGPTSSPCLHQAVDPMDVAFSRRVWDSLRPQMQELLTDMVNAYSRVHYTGIQEANAASWAKYAEAGVSVTRLPEEDATAFRKVSIPLWFKWANADPMAARIFQKHLALMQDPTVALIDPADIEGFELKL